MILRSLLIIATPYTERKWYILERKCCILERKCYILERKCCILERKCYILERKCCILERKCCILDKREYILERKWTFSTRERALSLVISLLTLLDIERIRSILSTQCRVQ